MSGPLRYTEFYTRTIQQHKVGFKNVPGGTGNGKTSAIPGVVATGMSGHQLLYVANRIQLLTEMAAKLTRENIPFVHLHRDDDLVMQLLQRPHLRAGLDDLLHVSSLAAPLAAVERASDRTLGAKAIRHAITQIEQLQPFAHVPTVAEQVERYARVLMHSLQRLLRETARGATGEERPRIHRDLTAHPTIRHLFPYIEFREAKKPVLLVTLHKLFHGFFDGRKMVNLSQLKEADGGYVVFLDEFDFLESNLIDLICNDAEIEAPFAFVENFYQAMTRHKLPLLGYPTEDSDVRRRIEQIIAEIDVLRNSGLNFPAINQFTCSSPQIKGHAIFQTTRTVTNRPLYLRQTERSFAVVPPDELADDEQGLSAFALFQAVTAAMRRILYLFKDLELRKPILYREMLNQCYAHTIFATGMGLIRQVPPRYPTQSTQFGRLLDNGYNLYEIHDLQQTSDRDEVSFRHFAINTTPEKLLLSLATHNLVFGLSATADIPRCVRSFSEEWLRQQEGFTFIPVDNADHAIIAELNTAKQAIRANQVAVAVAEDLDEREPLGHQLRQFIDAVAADEEFGGDDDGGYRRGRATTFFATLQWIIKRGPLNAGVPDTHLLFFNSFRQIRALLTRRPQSSSGFEVRPRPQTGSGRFDAYEVVFAGQCFLVLFYDARQGQTINTDRVVAQRYAELFWEELPVLVVTTYPSAGNGVNLQYRPTPDETHQTDFTHVHLLDAPYFYFGPVSAEQSATEQTATIKQNFWYLAKLFESKLLSSERFRRYLANIRYPGLSQEYRDNVSTARDALLNRVATYIQAIGRVERAWVKMPDQLLRCSREVYDDLATFCTGSAYADVFESRQNLNSPNLQCVWASIRHVEQRQAEIIERTCDERLEAINTRCREALDKLVNRLERFRQGQDSGAKEEWIKLREAVLRLDLHAPVLKHYHCLFQTSYAYQGTIYLDDNRTIHRKDAAPLGCRQWKLDGVYRRLRHNPIIERFFAKRGYELGVTSLAQTFLTPYCYQAILTGALGETAVFALLQHEHISLETPPDALFEIADLRITGRPWYIDAKYYSERTLDSFQMSPADADWLPKLNEDDFMHNAKAKFACIKAHHQGEGNSCKLIYLNLASTNDRARRYLSADGQFVATAADAQIIIIQGMLNSQQPDTYTDNFQGLLDELRLLLSLSEGA